MKQIRTLSERKRASIVEAAITEFLNKGFQATSMDGLAARACVSKRTVYNHFPSKEALFEEIAKELFDYKTEMTEITYEPARTLASQLRELALNELELLRSERFRSLVKVMLAECIRSPELTAKAVGQMNEHEQEQGLGVWIKAAISDGRLKNVDASYAAEQFIALIKAHAFWPQLLMGVSSPNEQECQRIVEDAVGMFLSYYQVD